MSTDVDTTQRVRAWLRAEDGKSADRLLDAALAVVESTPQYRPWFGRGRPDLRNLAVPVVYATVVVVAAVAIGLVASLAGPRIGGPPADPSASATPVVHLLRGALIQRGGLMECDLPDGDPIVIFDGNGDIVGTGVVMHPGGWSWGGGVHVSHFEVEDVPERTFYTIESGDLVNQSFSFADLADADWTLELEVPCGSRVDSSPSPSPTTEPPTSSSSAAADPPVGTYFCSGDRGTPDVTELWDVREDGTVTRASGETGEALPAGTWTIDKNNVVFVFGGAINWFSMQEDRLVEAGGGWVCTRR